MIPRWLLLVVGLLVALAAQPIVAKGDKPKTTSTTLNHTPLGLFYFEGTNTVLYSDQESHSVHISFDGGAEWEVVKGDDENMPGDALIVMPHPHSPERAYVIGRGNTHWITTDQGKSWRSFTIKTAMLSVRTNPPINFNGWDPKKAIFMTWECNILACMTEAFYTTDDFKTVTSLREAVYECSWAASTPQFGQDLDSKKSLEDRILCVVPGMRESDRAERLVYTDNFFQDDMSGNEVKLNQGRAVSGMEIKVRSVKKYIVAGVQSRGTTEQALYISVDSTEWHRAEFSGFRMEQDAYTLLESTNYSIQLDVQTTWHDNRVGVLFSSNSNGTYFSPNVEHTNRDMNGLVDFEKVADIQGIIIVNTVKNWEEVEESDKNGKKLRTLISFDDGRTNQSLKAGDDELHLHSMTTYDELRELSSLGRMFSSPAPGLVMGVGNTGDYLKEYSEGHLYVSDDAGLTWRHALKGPHRFEFGDQGGIIVAVKDGESTKKVQYSIDHGKEWEEIELKHKVKNAFLTTTPDSTSLKFLLVGASGDKDEEWTITSIDFEGLHERKCNKKDDTEIWVARVDKNSNADCLMGHKQSFQRRKANADCFIKNEFKMDPPIFEKCKCSAEDFECDYNFKRSEDRTECIPAVPLTAPAGKCKDSSDTYKGPSGWRLIPGNECIRDGGVNLDKEVERPCEGTPSSPISDGKVKVGEPQDFSSTPEKYYYLERQASNSGDDETIFMVTKKNELYVTHDHGKSWHQPSSLKSENVKAIIPHPYFTDIAFFLTDGDYIYSTIDRGSSFKKFKPPATVPSGTVPSLSFHEKHMDWIMWIGNECTGEDCANDAFISKNRGHEWQLMLRGVHSCKFTYTEKRKDIKDSDTTVMCAQYAQENPKNHRQLVSSDSVDDWTDKKVIKDNIAEFAMMDDFIVVATWASEDRKYLNVSTSLDAHVFAEARMPFNIDAPKYTVLKGSPYALFLQVEVNMKEGQEYGSLVKSNSNGTYFVQSLQGLSMNRLGYVDFEMLAGLEGVAIANVVKNKDDVESKAASKKLFTTMTHNDGGEWSPLAAPSRDINDKKFDCPDQSDIDCALHLHHYTERSDWRDTFYSGSAIGMMIGVGNVGEFLTDIKDADTFLSADGGFTWKQIKKGRYMYEYGDAGSIIVIVKEKEPTQVIDYSLDEGETWTEFQFSESQMSINDISTVPSDTSKNFLLWGEDKSGKPVTINLDFSGIWDRQCNMDVEDKDSDDYYLWTPQHPAQKDKCLFGHVEQYKRKRSKAECWNDWREPQLHRVDAQNCTCTRADFEW